MPTSEDEEAVQRGIARDPDAAELTDTELAEMLPASEVMPPEVYGRLVRRRGPGRKPAKVMISLRVEPSLAEALRGMGPGWQVRAGQALARLAKRSRAGRG